MVCYLGVNYEKNAYHTIAGYLKEFETLDVLPLQLKLECACYGSREI